MPWNPAHWLSAWIMAGLPGSTAVEVWNDSTRDPAEAPAAVMTAAPAAVMTAAHAAAPDVAFDRATWLGMPRLDWYVSGRDADGRAVGVEVGTNGKIKRIAKDVDDG